MPATRSILSVVKMMLEADLPHAEILATLDACMKALPKPDRHPIDRAPFLPGADCGESGDNSTLALSPAIIAETHGL